MAKQRVRVDHPLLRRLRRLKKEAARRFPDELFPGFERLGLRFDRKLDQSRYSDYTPLNCRTFADTGGDGVHFSLLVLDNLICNSSPVVLTVPPAGVSLVVGEDLFDFLCLGAHRGYFALEQLAYERELTLEAFTNPEWEPSASWHVSVGLVPGEAEKRLLEYLRNELGLQPWPNAERFEALQERYVGSIEFPTNK